MPLTQSQLQHWAAAKFLEVADETQRDKGNYVLDELYKPVTLTDDRIAYEHATRTGLPPARQYDDLATPDHATPTYGPVKRVDPVLFGLKTSVSYVTMRNRNVNKLGDLSKDLTRAGMIGRELQLLAPFIEGFASTTRYTDPYGVRIWYTGHRRPGGATFDSILDSTTLGLTWDNFVDAVTLMRMTHGDGLGLPLNYGYEGLTVLHGPLLDKDFWEMTQEHTRPRTTDRDENYIAKKMAPKEISCRLIDDNSWFILADGHYFKAFQREKFSVFLDKPESNNDVTTWRCREWFDAVPLEALGAIGSQGPAVS